MSGIIRFLKRQGPEGGKSWEPPPLTAAEKIGVERSLGLKPDRRKSSRTYDPAMDRAYRALRAVQARAKHKANPGLDAVVAKRAARVLRGK